MSYLGLYVAGYLLVGVILSEMGTAGYKKRGRRMKGYLYLFAVFAWPTLLLIAVWPRSNK